MGYALAAFRIGKFELGGYWIAFQFHVIILDCSNMSLIPLLYVIRCRGISVVVEMIGGYPMFCLTSCKVPTGS